MKQTRKNFLTIIGVMAMVWATFYGWHIALSWMYLPIGVTGLLVIVGLLVWNEGSCL